MTKTIGSKLCVLFVFFALIVGCHHAKKPDDFPPVHPCTITLLQEGKPLADANVILFSKDESCRWTVAGTTDASGVALIRTHGQFPGAPEGTFIVTVSKTDTDPYESGEIRTKPILVYTYVDKKYTGRSSSPLEIMIQKGKNNQKFDLGPDGRVLLETIAPGGA